MNTDTSVRLSNGVDIPRLGLGVYQAARGDETQQAVLAALRAGYRHIDTARIYENEADVGVAVAESGLPRSELFITTKLWNDDQGYDETLRAFDDSLDLLGLEYLDLFLIHWPVPQKRLDSWRAMERLAKDGRVRAIGVSNYMVHHLEELLAVAEVFPTVNQIEVSPFLQQREVRSFCRDHGITIEAYSPLTKARRLDDPAVVAAAHRVGRSPAQVLLRWCVQHDMVVLPKSVRPERVVENAALFDFELPAEEMARLDGLEEGLVTGWDPRSQP